MDINRMLAKSFCSIGARVMKSTIKHLMAGTGCFARVRLGKLTVVRYYNGTLFYLNVYARKQDDRTFLERVLSVSLKDFKTYYVHISEKMKDFSGSNQRNGWVLPADFNPLGYINDSYYLKGTQLRGWSGSKQ